MTHSPSSTVAERPPAMYRSATTAMVVSSTSMKVGMMTMAATSHGFTSARDLEGESANSVICRHPARSQPKRWPAIAARSLEETSRHWVRSAAC